MSQYDNAWNLHLQNEAAANKLLDEKKAQEKARKQAEYLQREQKIAPIAQGILEQFKATGATSINIKGKGVELGYANTHYTDRPTPTPDESELGRQLNNELRQHGYSASVQTSYHDYGWCKLGNYREGELRQTVTISKTEAPRVSNRGTYTVTLHDTGQTTTHTVQSQSGNTYRFVFNDDEPRKGFSF